jgi:hypothetical protein
MKFKNKHLIYIDMFQKHISEKSFYRPGMLNKLKTVKAVSSRMRNKLRMRKL